MRGPGNRSLRQGATVAKLVDAPDLESGGKALDKLPCRFKSGLLHRLRLYNILIPRSIFGGSDQFVSQFNWLVEPLRSREPQGVWCGELLDRCTEVGR